MEEPPQQRRFAMQSYVRARIFGVVISIIAAMMPADVGAEQPSIVKEKKPFPPGGYWVKDGFTPSGLTLDQPIRIKVGDAVFSVPAAYLNEWATADMAERTVEQPRGLAFSFWMPSLRPVLHKAMTPPIRLTRPEPGRPKPEPHEFIVVVNSVKFVPEDGEEITASRGIRNIDRDIEFGATDDLQRETRYGLDFVSYRKHSWVGRFYRTSLDAEPVAQLMCTEAGDAPIPICRGDVYYRKSELNHFLYFERSRLDKWKEVFAGVEALIKRWQANAKP